MPLWSKVDDRRWVVSMKKNEQSVNGRVNGEWLKNNSLTVTSWFSEDLLLTCYVEPTLHDQLFCQNVVDGINHTELFLSRIFHTDWRLKIEGIDLQTDTFNRKWQRFIYQNSNMLKIWARRFCTSSTLPRIYVGNIGQWIAVQELDHDSFHLFVEWRQLTSIHSVYSTGKIAQLSHRFVLN